LDISQSTWNVVWHMLDGVFFFAAVICFSAEMVIPKMIADLSDSALLLGLVPLVAQVAWLLPQTFYAKRIEGLAYKKPTVLFCAFLQRAGWLVFLGSLYVWWDARITLPIFFAVIAVNSLGSGLIVPVWTDWYAKTVPERMWGRLLGLRQAVPAVLGVGLGKLIEGVAQAHPAPGRYRILLLLSIVFYALSFLFVALVKEERHDGLPNQSKTSWKDYFRNLALLARRRDFGAFIAAAFLSLVPLTVMATFLTKYGLSYPGVPAGIAGRFTIFYFGAMAVGALLGGAISDRHGVLTPFRIFPALVTVGSAVAALSARPSVVSAAWSLLGFALGMRMAAMMPAVFSYAEPHRRPSYAAVVFTVVGVGAFVPPLLGIAKDANVVAFPHLFLLSAALAAVSWLMFLNLPTPQRPSA